MTASLIGPLLALLAGAALGGMLVGRRIPERPVVAVIAGAGGVVAAWAPPMATGHPAEDAVLRVLVVGLLALAGARAAPWVWVAAAAVTLAAAGTGAPAAMAAAALGLAVGSALLRDRPAMVGAGNGALVGLALMHLRWPAAPRASTAVGAATALVMIGAGYAALGSEGRRRARWVVAGVTLVVGLAGAGFAFGALRARRVGTAAVADATAGLASARRTDTAGAAAQFRASAVLFAAANRDVTAWWALPGRFLPGAAQQAAVIARLAAGGRTLAASAATTADAANPDAFRPHAGVVDVGRLDAIRPTVDASVAAVDRVTASVRGPDSVWLAGPVTRQLGRLRAKLQTARDQAVTLRQVVDVLPGMLGAHGARHYLLIAQTPAEMRAGGGIVGNYGELTALDGRLRLTRFGRDSDLNPIGSGQRVILRPADYLERYLRFGADLYWQNATLSPDFPSVASVVEQLYPQSGGEPVDGVVSVDPIALAAILRLTGPVAVAGWPVPITADNAEQVLLHDQYAQLQDHGERVDFLADTTRQVVNRLTTASLPGPSTLIDVLGPIVRGKHLELHSIRAPEEALIAHMGATGALPPVADDYFALVGQNGSASKIDWYLHRDVTYRPTFDPATGAVRATADVRITNDAPATGEPPYILGGGDPSAPVSAGQNRMYLSFYSPLALTGATLDGRPVPMESELEGGRFVYSMFVIVPPEGEAAVHLDLAGRVSPGETYRVDIGEQPTIHPDVLTVAIGAVGGWRPLAPPSTPSPLAGNETLTASFRRAG